MKRLIWTACMVSVFMVGCAARQPHITWAPGLDKGLAKARSANIPTIINFTSPT